MTRKPTKTKPATNNEKRRANRLLISYRLTADRIRDLEQHAEDTVTTTRDRLAAETAPLRKKQSDLKTRLAGYYRTHRTPDSRCLDLQDGRIGERVVPRVVLPKSAVDRVPAEALSVKRRVNKTVLRAMGDEAVTAAGGRIVRPLRFYVAPAVEDAEK